MADDSNLKHERKSFYKKWWFWLLVMIIIIIIAVNTAGKDENINSNNEQKPALTGKAEITPGLTAAVTKTADDTDTDNDAQNSDEVTEVPEEDKPARDNTSAILTILNSGSFTAGADIPAGRYFITADKTGNLLIYDTTGLPYINEILGGNELGVESVTTDISDGDKIEISGIDKVTFTPADTKLAKDTLTTGNWVAGIDLAAGRYDVTSEENGNFFVYDRTGIPVVNEILGGGDIGVEKVTVNLEDGFGITISGMNKVKFIRK